MKGNISNEALTGADESLSVDAQGNVCDEHGASNGSETTAPAVFDQQLASSLQGRNLSCKAPWEIRDLL